MIPVLFLSHAAIALAAVLLSGAGREARERFLQGLAIAGGLSGLVLFFAAPLLGERWRTIEMTPSGTRIAGAAIVAAWILAAVGERSRGGGRWDIVALTGVASTALCMFSVNRWTVPALLFASIACLALVLLHDRVTIVAGALAAGIALLGGALLWRTLDVQTWELPAPLTGAQLWIAVAAAVAFALAAVVDEPGDRPHPSTPLALGLSFATLGSVARGTGPVIALALVAAALVAVVRSLLKERVSQRLVMVWIVALTVGLAALSGDLYVTTRSGIAGILAASAVALWPLSLGRAQIERGILIAFVAVTAGFNAIASAAGYSFERATSIERVVDAAPWAAIAALLPAALAGGVALGASVGRNPEPDEYTRSGVLGSWALVILSVIVGLFPYLGDVTASGLGGPGLYVVAVAAGVGAARYARGLGATEPAPTAGSHFEPVPLGVPWPKPASIAVAALGAATALGVLALTFQGLRLGFL